jgi:fructose-1,6-bisphosphatase/inositol monophosphatase family enzyme
MHTGLWSRSVLLDSLAAPTDAGCAISEAAKQAAVAVIEATDRALSEEAGDEAGSAAGDAALAAKQIKQKAIGDYVTSFDMALDRQLTRALEGLAAIPVVSEEGPADVDLHDLSDAWLIDPLDGTTAYLCGERGLCGPMVARVERGVPRLSVMLAVDGRTLGIAERDHGACVLHVSPEGGRWLPPGNFAAIDDLRQGCLLFNPQSDAGRSHPAFVKLHEAIRTGLHTLAAESRIPHSMASLGLGTGRRLAVIHDNSADHPKQMAWDVLPAQLWVEERGGVYWGIDGHPYDIRRPMPIIAATRADIAERLVALAEA